MKIIYLISFLFINFSYAGYPPIEETKKHVFLGPELEFTSFARHSISYNYDFFQFLADEYNGNRNKVFLSQLEPLFMTNPAFIGLVVEYIKIIEQYSFKKINYKKFLEEKKLLFMKTIETHYGLEWLTIVEEFRSHDPTKAELENYKKLESTLTDGKNTGYFFHAFIINQENFTSNDINAVASKFGIHLDGVPELTSLRAIRYDEFAQVHPVLNRLLSVASFQLHISSDEFDLSYDRLEELSKGVYILKNSSDDGSVFEIKPKDISIAGSSFNSLISPKKNRGMIRVIGENIEPNIGGSSKRLEIRTVKKRGRNLPDIEEVVTTVDLFLNKKFDAFIEKEERIKEIYRKLNLKSMTLNTDLKNLFYAFGDSKHFYNYLDEIFKDKKVAAIFLRWVNEFYIKNPINKADSYSLQTELNLINYLIGSKNIDFTTKSFFRLKELALSASNSDLYRNYFLIKDFTTISGIKEEQSAYLNERLVSVLSEVEKKLEQNQKSYLSYLHKIALNLDLSFEFYLKPYVESGEQDAFKDLVYHFWSDLTRRLKKVQLDDASICKKNIQLKK